MDVSDTFCVRCFSAKELIEIVESEGHPQDKCPVCNATQTIAINADHQLFKRVFRALIRVSYSEWDYNGHLGGEELSSLLFGSNSIMDLKPGASLEEFETAFKVVEDSWYPATEEEIELGGGYWDGSIVIGLKSRLSGKLVDLLEKTFTENYFSVQQQLSKLFEAVIPDVSAELAQGSRFFRARIGTKERVIPFSMGFEKEYLYVPYSDREIGNPPVHMATEGRLNRARVSLLYLASDRDTAIAEVRPHPGHLVSTAEFQSTAPLKVADLANYDVRNFLSDSRLEVLRLIFSFNALLNMPVTPDRRDAYLVTQLLSDCVREAGFDGVCFRSSVGAGVNYVFFKSDVCAPISKTEEVVAVKALTYRFEPVPTASVPYVKDQFDETEDDPLSTLMDVLARHR